MNAGTFLFACLLFLGCASPNKKIRVLTENNCEECKIVEIKTYLDGEFISTRSVPASRETVKFDVSELILQGDSKVKFVLNNGKATECFIKKDSINSRSLIHLNYNVLVFKKGDRYESRILTSDTVLENKFYCEIMYDGFPH